LAYYVVKEGFGLLIINARVFISSNRRFWKSASISMFQTRLVSVR